MMLETGVANAHVLIPPMNKEGNLKVRDYWRRISLLDVVGKVLGRILQDRLKAVAKYVILHDFQCGYKQVGIVLNISY